VDEIAVAWNPAIEAETVLPGYLSARRWRTEHLLQVPSRFLGLSKRPAASVNSHRDLWQDAPPITYVDHYLAHIGNAAFLSPYETCAVLVLDGRGERQTSLMARVHGVNIEVLQETNFPHSLGLVYGAVTQYLGFRPDSDEWKVMALAAYADPNNRFLEPMRRLVRVQDNGTFRVALEYFEYYNFTHPKLYSDQFVATFGPPRDPEDPIEKRHEEVAAALQQAFEETVTQLLHQLHRRTALDRLVVSGGCFMNSVFNGKITQATPFKECHITSCPDDSGTSIGAALYLHALRTGQRPPTPPAHNYWGLGFTDEECRRVVERFKLPNTQGVADPAQRAADDLAAGLLVGWFQGRAEFGQRALGNRSILADPRRAEVKAAVNAAVKYRESFRPFAPAVLAERVADYFDCPTATEVPFMERVLPFRKERRAEVPAVVHVDGSGRLQTVDGAASPRFRRLIEHFAAITGVPIVLNTSFNLNAEPIVNSPEDAIRTFYSCGLDVLYLGDIRIAK
jgi:carbamoyltransferase